MAKIRNLVLPVAAAAAVAAAMAWQGAEREPTLAAAPPHALPELPGFASERLEASEAELHTLPPDTMIDKRRYVAGDGGVFTVEIVVGGRSKSSIHRPELCLPTQGFKMSSPGSLDAAGISWHTLVLERRDAPPHHFAYTFFNQDGFRTSSHVARIFRDVWDRSVNAKIDRWAMVTVTSLSPDRAALAGFLEKLAGIVWKGPSDG